MLDVVARISLAGNSCVLDVTERAELKGLATGVAKEETAGDLTPVNRWTFIVVTVPITFT